jgi:hypothetical protein
METENAARGDYTQAADDQRDASEFLAQAMIDGDSAKDVRLRLQSLISKQEAFERVTGRTRLLGDEFRSLFRGDDLAVRDQSGVLAALSRTEQDTLNAAQLHEVCLSVLAIAYVQKPAANGENPKSILCGRTDVYYAEAHADGTPQIELLDRCEYAIEKQLDLVSADLSQDAHRDREDALLLARLRRWASSIFSKAARPVPSARPDAPAAICNGMETDQDWTVAPGGQRCQPRLP